MDWLINGILELVFRKYMTESDCILNSLKASILRDLFYFLTGMVPSALLPCRDMDVKAVQLFFCLLIVHSANYKLVCDHLGEFNSLDWSWAVGRYKLVAGDDARVTSVQHIATQTTRKLPCGTSLTVADILGATKTSFLAGHFSSWNTTLLSNGVKIPISRLFADIQASFELQPQEALSINEYKSLQRISSAEDFSVGQYVEAELKKSEGSYRPREMTASDRLLQASFPSVFNAESPQRKRQNDCLSSSPAVIMDSSSPASSVDPLSGLLDADSDAGEDDANHNGLKTPPLRRKMSRVL